MRLVDSDILTTGSRAVRATVAAVVGQVDSDAHGGTTFHAELSIDGDADVPGGVQVLEPGTSRAAVVRVGPDRPGSEARWMHIKIPEAYGAGKDQDFLLASSGDGAPLHHAVIPSPPVAELYSTLWLFLAGLRPVLFGVRPPTTGADARFGSGDSLSFQLSPPVGKFRPIGTLSLGKQSDEPVSFAGGNSGGGIRPLPPVSFY